MNENKMTWISCEDSHPDADQLVWVWDDFAEYALIGRFCRKQWEVLFGDTGFTDDCDVTHWMPIIWPSPPSKEQQK